MFGKPLFPTYNLKTELQKTKPPSKFESTLPSSSAEDDPPIDQVITKKSREQTTIASLKHKSPANNSSK
jgi:hypothetical protein